MMGLTLCVTKLISPKKMLVPILMMTATPMVSKKSMGEIQLVVVSRSIIIMMGTRMQAAPTTSLTTRFCMLAVLAALPEMAPPSPIMPYRASTASLSRPSSIVTW